MVQDSWTRSRALVLTNFSPFLFPFSILACSLLDAFCFARMFRIEYSVSGCLLFWTVENSNQS